MKKYFEYMAEISKDELLEGLIGYGLFPDKLPPIFTSKQFFEKIKSLYFDRGRNVSPHQTDYIKYENIRSINVPRYLAIPNPFSYAYLCKIISDNWEKLQSFFAKTTKNHKYKISRIHIRKIKGKKYLFEMNYKNFLLDEDPLLYLRIGKKFVVKTDISSFFSSIYSHSIPWVIKGKRKAKIYRNHWSDKLDKALRNTKYGETDGLLIGPHASNIVSEAVLCKIDSKLYNKGYRFIRNIDDYECYTGTYKKAEKFLLDLSSELKKYNLTLNYKKTVIKEIIEDKNNWISQINYYASMVECTQKGNQNISLKHIRNFWISVLDLFIKNKKDSAILNYAIKIISKKSLNVYALEYHQKTVLHLTLLYPYLVNLLDQFLFIPFSFKPDTIKQFSDKILANGLSKKLFESVSYAIFFSIKYDFELEENNLFYRIKHSNDTIALVLSYLYDKARNVNIINKYEDLARKLKEKGNMNKYWLFIYEVLPYTELIYHLDDRRHTTCKEFSKIKKQGVSFIKSI